jgi:tetratricopeptide (TPR) repeat protein
MAIPDRGVDGEPSGSRRFRGAWPRLCALGLALVLGVTYPAFAADADLARAEQFMQDARYEEAMKLFQRSLEASPSASAAHLGLGRAYLALGDYAAARIEFETVLRFDDLPSDLHQQVEI